MIPASGVITISFDVTATDAAAEVGEIINVAFVVTPPGEPPIITPEVPVEVDPRDPDPVVPNPTIGKSASPTSVQAGDTITYTLTVTNPSGTLAIPAGRVVGDDLDLELVEWVGNVRATVQLPETAVTNLLLFHSISADGEFRVTLPAIPAGAIITIHFDVIATDEAAEEGTINNVAFIVTEDDEPPIRTPEIPVEVEPRPEEPTVEITKRTAATVVAGGTLTYTITVENTGNVELTGLVVTDTLPAQLENPRNLVAPAGATYTIDGRTVTVTLGTLAPDQTVTITFVVTVAAGTAVGTGIRNTATVTDPNNPDVGDEDSVTTFVRPPEPPDEDPWRQAFLIGDTVPPGQPRPIRPQGDITRAEVATIFFRLIPDEVRAHYWTQTNPFSDVTIDRWFNNAISTTNNMGLFGWLGDSTFAPDQAITRGELAAVLVRFMNRDQIGPFSANAASGGDEFHDIATHWARTYINEAARNGWVLGDSVDGVLAGLFRPGDTITRAETAAMINRIFQRLVETPDCLLDDMVTWHDNANENRWYFLYVQMATNSFTYTWGDNGYMELLEIINPRDWSVLERPFSRPEHILSRSV